ncbi:MAG TPA: PQQ-binding-like beta-propeller repeat protein, partial [Candidatus Bathyarchaeia archaeon]|nr:PQQ-binding-like beta-propeller repeat protein [Candidatus Bathyarchaeia archaeon]
PVYWQWRPPQNGIIPFSDGIMWSMPLATSIAGAALPGTLSINSGCIEAGVIFMTAAYNLGEFSGGYQIEAGYNANTGAQLWITNRTEPANTEFKIIPATAGIYAEVNQNTNTLTGFSMTTGTKEWGPITLPDVQSYTSVGGYQYVSANGIDYLWGFGGTIYAINMANGVFNWYTNTTVLTGPSGSDTPYAIWPLWTFTVGSVAGGELFVPEGHQYSPPLFNGAQQLAINCTNGQLVWSNLAFDVTSGPAISDGVMIAFNSYDNQIYAYGQGPTKICVNAPDVSVTTAAPITITGTVTDISAGSQQNAIAMNFPNGLPCVSDASMEGFMDAVYEQQPMPTNITGVPVTLSVLDSNGNYRSIGTTTTNALGDYSFTWTPDISGKYTVYATFAGTDAYYGSSASTGFYAGASAATSAPTATPLTGLASNTTVMYAVVAMIIVFIVGIAIVALLVTRKHP